jgi:acylphosphatase
VVTALTSFRPARRLLESSFNVRVERRRVVVHGFVQGVGFRLTVERAARSRSLAGWVRHRPDATVEAVFEGAAEDVAALVELCRRGPRGAEVERVEVAAEELEGLSGFWIR